ERRPDPGEFVAERHWGRLPGPGRRRVRGGAEDRTVQVLMQIGAADPTEGDVDEHFAGTGGGFVDLLDADVLVAVIACCAHGDQPSRLRSPVASRPGK